MSLHFKFACAAILLLVGRLVSSLEFPPNVQLIAVGGCLDTNCDVTTEVDGISLSNNRHTKLTDLPTGLAYFGRTVFNNTFYVVGGILNDGSFTNAFFAFSPTANVWTRLPDFPANVRQSAVVAINNVIYVLGGELNWKTDYSNYAYKYDMDNQVWWRITSPLPVIDKDVSCAVTYQSSIYLIFESGQVYRSTDASSWSQLASIPLGRFSASCVALKSGLIVVAGGYAGGDVDVDEVYIYDISLDSWSTAPSMLKVRNLADAVVVSTNNTDFVIVCGGKVDNSNMVYDDCEVFSMKTHQWGKAGVSLDIPRFSLGLFLTQN